MTTRRVSEVVSRVPGLDRLDAGRGPALAITEAEARSLVLAALSQASARASQPASTPGKLVRFRRPALLVGAMIAATSAAAATVGSRWTAELWAPEAAPEARSRVAVVAPPRAVAPLAVEPASLEAVEAEPIEADPTEAVAAPTRRSKLRESSPAARESAARTPRRATPAGRSVETARAIDSLSRASGLRGARRFGEALAVYRRVLNDYPGTLQAQAGAVAAADLELEHRGDARSAERLYRLALSQPGPLAAEARFGIARARRAAGDAVGEQRALRRFLSDHARSPLSAAARRRLAALGGS